MKCDHCVLYFLALVMFCVCHCVSLCGNLSGCWWRLRTSSFLGGFLEGLCVELKEEFLYLQIFESLK